MSSERTTYRASVSAVTLQNKFAGLLKLTKPRLTMLVAFSALVGYQMAPTVIGFDVVNILLLFCGGYMVTGSANTFNQLLEIETDKLMQRTASRPLVTGLITTVEAVVFALILGIGGVSLIGWMFGTVPMLLAIIAILSYAFVYTPLKRITPLCVLIGAFPGSMPVLIGWAAATGSLDTAAWSLFLIQFLWQFPHFWSIGWLLEADYKKAGLKMLPYNAGKSRASAFLILMYTALLIPAMILPWKLAVVGTIGIIIASISGLVFMVPAVRLLQTLDIKYAKRVMFMSFAYLPVIQITFLIDKI